MNVTLGELGIVILQCYGFDLIYKSLAEPKGVFSKCHSHKPSLTESGNFEVSCM